MRYLPLGEGRLGKTCYGFVSRFVDNLGLALLEDTPTNMSGSSEDFNVCAHLFDNEPAHAMGDQNNWRLHQVRQKKRSSQGIQILHCHSFANKAMYEYPRAMLVQNRGCLARFVFSLPSLSCNHSYGFAHA